MRIDSSIQPAAQAPQTAPLTEEQTAARREALQAVQRINAIEALGDGYELTFALDRETRQPLIRIINRRTTEVVRQIPPEEVLNLDRWLRQEQKDGQRRPEDR